MEVSCLCLRVFQAIASPPILNAVIRVKGALASGCSLLELKRVWYPYLFLYRSGVDVSRLMTAFRFRFRGSSQNIRSSEKTHHLPACGHSGFGAITVRIVVGGSKFPPCVLNYIFPSCSGRIPVTLLYISGLAKYPPIENQPLFEGKGWLSFY